MVKVRTIEEVKNDFNRKGLSIAGWAKRNKLRVSVVYDLINGRTVGARGEAHNAAVLLGLKEGELNTQHQGGEQI